MHIRHYKTEDAEAISQLFLDTVQTINARDYTAGELAAWTVGNTEPSVWHKKLTSAKLALVAEKDGVIAGFSDLTHEGVLCVKPSKRHSMVKCFRLSLLLPPNLSLSRWGLLF